METKKIKSRVIKTSQVKWKELEFIQDSNFKEWINDGDKKLIESLLKYQFVDPFKVWENEGKIYCLDGKHRYLDLLHIESLGIEIPEELPATFMECESKGDAAELVLIYSSQYAKITQQGLFDFTNKFSLDFPSLLDQVNIPGFDTIEFMGLFTDSEKEKIEITKSSLQEEFIIPPFSILDSKSGIWQQRKSKWLSLGFDSQESREDVELIAKSGQSTAIYELRNKMRNNLGRDPEWDEIIDYAKSKGMFLYEGASIFDPVLCELSYRWFCVEQGSVLDPFAGGSVRGIVASTLGYIYHGIDLRKEQIEINRIQAEKLELKNINWYTGDSNEQLDNLDIPDVDFVFSCPPYADLEVYSDDPKDLSNMDYYQFKKVYFDIIAKSVNKLKEDRFACFVVGDVRDKKGFYYNFVSDTIEAFQSAGMKLYNEIILVNTIGSLAIRVKRQFNSGRKVGKMHQNVLVFYKGNPKNIKDNFPKLNLTESLIIN